MGFDRKMMILGVIAGLAILARTDNIFLVAAAFVFVFARQGRVSWTALGWCAAVIAPWFAFNLIKFGTVVQSSAQAYPWLLHQEFQGDYLLKYFALTVTEWNMLGMYFGSPALLAILLAAIWYLAPPKPTLWVIVAVVAMLAVHTYIRWFPRLWYQQSAFIVILFASSGLIWRIRSKGFLLAMAGIFLTCSTLTITAPGGIADGWKKQTRERVAVGMVRRYVPAGETVAAWNSGYLMYWIADRNPCINLDGLANHEVMGRYKVGTFAAYLREKHIRWIVDAPSYFNRPFGRYFEGGIDRVIGGGYSADNIALPGNSMWLAQVKGEDGGK